MANELFQQFHYSKVKMLTMIEGSVLIGASGAVTSVNSNGGFLGATKLATGTYQLQMTGNYNSFIGSHFCLEAGTTGSPVADGSLVTGTTYQITVVGTTNWAAVGLAAGLTPTVGQSFVATGAGGAGTGTATAIGNTAIVAVEVLQGAQVSLQNSVQGSGAIINIQCKSATATIANPTSGARIRFQLWFKNSSVLK